MMPIFCSEARNASMPPSKSTVIFFRATDGKAKGSGVASIMAVALRCDAGCGFIDADTAQACEIHARHGFPQIVKTTP